MTQNKTETVTGFIEKLEALPRWGKYRNRDPRGEFVNYDDLRTIIAEQQKRIAELEVAVKESNDRLYEEREMWDRMFGDGAKKLELLELELKEMQQAGDAEVGGDTYQEQAGYWCVVCGRYLQSNDGVIVHDDVPHPLSMTFEETMQ